jgi:DNA-binding response OmpR family regulator
MRILVVEDNELVADGLVRILAHLGHEPHKAFTILEARAILKKVGSVDAAIVDAGLPAGDHGVDFVNWLKAHHATTRRILISGLDRPINFLDDLPIQCFLKKPFGRKELEQLFGVPSNR